MFRFQELGNLSSKVMLNGSRPDLECLISRSSRSFLMAVVLTPVAELKPIWPFTRILLEPQPCLRIVQSIARVPRANEQTELFYFGSY